MARIRMTNIALSSQRLTLLDADWPMHARSPPKVRRIGHTSASAENGSEGLVG